MLNINYNNNNYEVAKGTTLLELADKFQSDFKFPILLASVNNNIQQLDKKITYNCNLDFYDISSSHGYRVYQRSVLFLMVTAIKELFGKDSKIRINYTFEHNFVCEKIDGEFSEQELQQILAKMKKLDNLFIEEKIYTVEEAGELLKSLHIYDKSNMLNFVKSPHVHLYKLNENYDFFFGEMIYETSKLQKFDLKKNDKTFTLIFPQRMTNEIVPAKIYKKSMQVFDESSKWAEILKVNTITSLNETICQNKIQNLIQTSEALHEKKIAYLADEITNRGRKLVLIAGPSSSGKTTFAERLSIQLRVNGYNPQTISLDNYYLSRDKYPLDEYGKPDYEALEALDLPLINQHFNELLDGKVVSVPTFNFLNGQRGKGKNLQIDENKLLIVEGIHGLNPHLANLPKDKVYKIFISPLTHLNIDNHNRIPTTDIRMLRRIVRDFNFRGTSAKNTLAMWPSVARGESKNIFPFQEEADGFFNSALFYEVCILKQYAESLLFTIQNTDAEYAEARRLLRFLDCILGVSSENVPINSILREFIGGSRFE